MLSLFLIGPNSWPLSGPPHLNPNQTDPLLAALCCWRNVTLGQELSAASAQP